MNLTTELVLNHYYKIVPKNENPYLDDVGECATLIGITEKKGCKLLIFDNTHSFIKENENTIRQFVSLGFGNTETEEKIGNQEYELYTWNDYVLK